MNVIDTVNKAFVANELLTIDPGKSNGSIAKYNDDGIKTWPLKKFTNFEDLVDFLRYQKEICKLPLIIIEKVNTFRGDFEKPGMTEEQKNRMRGRAYNLDKMKRHYSELISAIKLSSIPYIEVTPMSWQSFLKIYIPKEDYQIRKRRYTDLAKDWFPRVKVAGWNADALLLIEFTRRKLRYDNKWILSKLNSNEKQKKISWKE